MSGSVTLGTVVRRATALLSDNEAGNANVRWTVGELVGYANEALREISALRPEAYATLVELTLVPGNIQRLDPDKYSQLFAIEEVISDFGPPSRVYEADHKYYRLTPPRAQPFGDEPPTIKSFVKHPFDEQTFFVVPAVPPAQRLRVRATVAARPRQFDETSLTLPVGLRPEFEAQVVDWVMWRALSADHESPHARESAVRYRDAFTSSMVTKTAPNKLMPQAPPEAAPAPRR